MCYGMEKFARPQAPVDTERSHKCAVSTGAGRKYSGAVASSMNVTHKNTGHSVSVFVDIIGWIFLHLQRLHIIQKHVYNHRLCIGSIKPSRLNRLILNSMSAA